MVSLGLVTHDHLEGEPSQPPPPPPLLLGPLSLHSDVCFVSAEIQSKRQERKRRTTANPVYSGAVFEPEVQGVLLASVILQASSLRAPRLNLLMKGYIFVFSSWKCSYFLLHISYLLKYIFIFTASWLPSMVYTYSQPQKILVLISSRGFIFIFLNSAAKAFRSLIRHV